MRSTLTIYGDKHFYSSASESSGPKMRRHRNPDGSRGGLIAETAKVSKTVHVGPNACIDGTAQVSGKVRLLGHAYVGHQAKVSENVVVSQKACVQGNSQVKGKVHVSGRVIIEHYAKVSGGVKISGHVMIQDGAEIEGEGLLSGHLVIGSKDVNMPWGPGIQ